MPFKFDASYFSPELTYNHQIGDYPEQLHNLLNQLAALSPNEHQAIGEAVSDYMRALFEANGVKLVNERGPDISVDEAGRITISQVARFFPDKHGSNEECHYSTSVELVRGGKIQFNDIIVGSKNRTVNMLNTWVRNASGIAKLHGDHSTQIEIKEDSVTYRPETKNANAFFAAYTVVKKKASTLASTEKIEKLIRSGQLNRIADSYKLSCCSYMHNGDKFESADEYFLQQYDQLSKHKNRVAQSMSHGQRTVFFGRRGGRSSSGSVGSKAEAEFKALPESAQLAGTLSYVVDLARESVSNELSSGFSSGYSSPNNGGGGSGAN